MARLGEIYRRRQRAAAFLNIAGCSTLERVDARRRVKDARRRGRRPPPSKPK